MDYTLGLDSCDQQQGKRISWLMDSGASQSVTNSLSDFWDYQPYSTPVSFGTAGKTVIQAIGSGTVKGFVTVEGGKRVWITLTNVAYIPNASGRLFSTGVVENSGHTLVQGSGSMVIYDRVFKHGTVSGNRIMEAMYNPLNNLYYMFMDILDRNVANAMISPYRLWHRRMGHPSKEVIRRLPGNTKGADPVGVEDHSPCEGCQWGKSHRAPFPTSYKRATKPLELVHTDEDGPMRTTSIEGYRYFISFLDDYTSLGRAYHLKHKSDAIQAFEDFKAWAENVTGHKLIGLRSDRGGEYTSDAFATRLKAYGITHYKTVAGSPQQNGRAERWNRTIMEKALAMLHHAGLSHGFWKLAVDVAVHIYNCQPMHHLNWQCPQTLWNGTIPDISYFRVFGCKVFVHVPKEQRQGKLDKKAIEMIFVGYEPGSKGYCFWNPATRRIIVSCDVTFDEESFPARKDLVNPRTRAPEIFEPVDSDSEDDDEEQFDLPLPLPIDTDIDSDNEEIKQEPAKPVGDAPPKPDPVPVPQPAYSRPKRDGAGRNPWRNKDNVYGDEPPALIDGRTDSRGNQRAELFMMIKALQEANHTVPNSHSEAKKSIKWELWHKAEGSEMESHKQNGTWVLVPRPKGRKVIKNRWVYARKHDGRYKARLVAKGFTQVWGEDYHETFSPVARFESLRYMFAHAALEDWEMDSMDVKTAFLNGDLDEEIYMEQPEGWVVPGKEDWVCLLKKAIYGLKQASRQWNAKIHKSLLEIGFTRTYSDAGVYVYSRETGDHTCIVILYVDDLLLMGDSKPFIEEVKRKLKLEYQMTDLGPVERFLGLRIRRERRKRQIFVDQAEYIQTVLERFQMHNSVPANTPLPAGAVLEKNVGTSSESFRTLYQSIIGSIMYAMLGTRPDIAFAVTRLSKFASNPSQQHLNYARYILKYLQGTKEYALCYDGASNSGLIAYSDSDWAEDRDDRH